MPSKSPPAVEVSSLKESVLQNSRIAVLCTIIALDPKDYSGIASDSSGEAVLRLDEDSFKKAKEGSMFRILGRAFKENNNVLINVEAIQSFDSSLTGLYSKVKELEARNRVF